MFVKSLGLGLRKNHTCLAQDSNAVFKLQRSTKVLELTYLGEYFVCKWLTPLKTIER